MPLEEPPFDLDAWAPEDPDFPLQDWRHEVAEDSTRLGYWDWVAHRREMKDLDALTPPPCLSTQECIQRARHTAQEIIAAADALQQRVNLLLAEAKAKSSGDVKLEMPPTPILPMDGDWDIPF